MCESCVISLVVVLNTFNVIFNIIIAKWNSRSKTNAHLGAYTKLHLLLPYLFELCATVKLKTDDRHCV